MSFESFAKATKRPVQAFQPPSVCDASNYHNSPGKPSNDDFVDRQNPVIKSINEMLDIINDFKCKPAVEKYWPKEDLDDQAMQSLASTSMPMGRTLNIPVDDAIDREELRNIQYLIDNEHVAANAILPFANAHSGSNVWSRQQRRAALQELLTM